MVNLSSGRRRPVPVRLLVGRSPTCALQIDDRHVSGEHATLMWTGRTWEIRDLGSRNGTFVDGQRMEAGGATRLASGTRIAFGNESDLWELADDAAPSAMAENLANARVVSGLNGMLALPDAGTPDVVVFEDRGRWVLEAEGQLRALRDEEVVQAGGEAWRIRLPGSVEGTAAVDSGPTVDTVTFRFAVSRDEEHVQLTVIHRGEPLALEAREHAYVLLTLARARREDAELPEAEQGWRDRDQLLRMLGLDTNGLNVAIYRARGQLSAAGLDGAAGVVEVRRGQRRIGVSVDRLFVERM